MLAPAFDRSRIALAVTAILLAANMIVPAIWGDVYPFTTGPMFRDCPQRLCNYRVYWPAERELPAEHWLAQRIYDGNPSGYGVGLVPPDVLERQFGSVADEAAIRRHSERQLCLPANEATEYVEVVQEVVGPIDGQAIGVAAANRWRIERPSAFRR
jgi:hypothetical protein